MSEAKQASVQGVPGEHARARGVLRALWPLLAAVFLAGVLAGLWLPAVNPAGLGAGLLVAAVLLAWATLHCLRGVEGYFKGARGEERVALLLEGLPGGYHVFHDLPCVASGGIDHVVVGPTGFFVIETKFWSGAVTVEEGEVRVDGAAPSRAPVAQAYAACGELMAFLGERIGAVPACVPVVCFASNTLAGGAVRVRDVWVCNAKELLPLLLERSRHVTAEDLERIVRVLERKDA